MKHRSRADLLRALVAQQACTAFFTGLAEALGFEKLADDAESGKPTRPESTGIIKGALPGLKFSGGEMFVERVEQVYWHVAACIAQPTDQALPTPVDPGDDSSPVLQPRQRLERHQPLLSAGQWQNLWDRMLPQPHRSPRIDHKRSLRLIARARPVADLPRRQHWSFNRSVTLIWDYSEENYPAWPDMRETWKSLKGLLGRAELQVLHLPAGPEGGLLDTLTGEWVDMEVIPARSLALLVGTFGGLHTGRISPAWLNVIQGVKARAASLQLMPLCPLQPSGFEYHPPDPAHRQGPASQAVALETLLNLLTQSWRTSRTRLRQLRRLVPHASLHTELLAYNHPQAEHKDQRLDLLPEQLPVRQRSYSQLHATLREQVEQLVASWAEQSNALEIEAAQLQRRMLDNPQPDDYPALMQLALRVQRSHREGRPQRQAFQHINALLPLIGEVARQCADVSGLQPIYQTGAIVARSLGKPQPMRELGLPNKAPNHHLRVRGNALVCELGNGRAVVPGRSLLALSDHAYCEQDRLTLTPGMELPPGPRLDIVDNAFRYTLEAYPKPTWAQRIWQDAEGLHAAHAEGSIYRLLPAGPERPQARWECRHNNWRWATDTGIDEYGLWAECRVQQVTFRLRWIAPGSFMMGSPESEVDREEDETRHQVSLTQGYWLGETVVTQALWRAVTGENPAHFKGDDLPVESVSWEDARRFIELLGEFLLPLSLALPTEAQWEYACRAGSDSAFSWGDTLSIEQASYYGDSYNGGPEGKYQGIVVPAKYFQANAWGLYQMHGNVWEWCVDWRGAYPTQLVIDPTGPAEGPNRVVRGGSWNHEGRYLRSAQRGSLSPDARGDFVGLRLAGGADPRASTSEALSADRWPRSGQSYRVAVPADIDTRGGKGE